MVVLRNVKGRDRSTLRQHGPCLTCRVETQYGLGGGKGLAGTHVQYGDDWLDRQAKLLSRFNKPFLYRRERSTEVDPSRSIVEVSTSTGKGLNEILYARGTINSISGVQYALVKPYICRACQKELETRLAEFIETARQQAGIDADLREFESTWRRPNKGEFPIEKGGWAFTLVAPTLSFWNIHFQWRTSKLSCKGSSPAFVILMTVDGVKAGVCTGPLESIRDHKNEPVENVEYVATVLLTNWIQANLQSDLLSVDSLFIWDAKTPNPCGHYNGQPREPGVLQTIWIDGSLYAVLIDFFRLADVWSFLERMSYQLIEQNGPDTSSPLPL
jgi:hypothetical protein